MLKVNVRFDRLKALPSIGGRECIGVDLNGNHATLVLVRPSSGGAKVIAFAERQIAGLADPEIAKMVREAAIGLGSKRSEAALLISSNLVITKNIEIPSTNPQEIAEIINLQAGRHTPYAREEIIVDHLVIGAYKHAYTKVLLIIVARNVVKRQCDILDRAGLKIEKVLFAAEGIGTLIGAIPRPENLLLPIAALHINETHTDFMIIVKERVAYVRSIPLGASQLSEPIVERRQKFVEEVKESLEAYRNEDVDRPPAAIVLAGALAASGGAELENLVKDALKLPVRSVDLITKNPHVSEEAARSAAALPMISLLGVVAPMVRSDAMKVSLVPEEVKLRKALENRGRDLMMTGIYVLTVFLLIFSTFLAKVYFKAAYLQRFEAKYRDVSREARALEASLEKSNLVKSHMWSRGYSLEVLAELHKIAPFEVELSDIRYDEQGKFSIKGVAESMSTVFKFVDLMAKTNYFKDVKTKYTAKRKEGSKDVTDFEIIALLTKKRQA